MRNHQTPNLPNPSRENTVILNCQFTCSHLTDLAYSVGVIPNFSLNCREK